MTYATRIELYAEQKYGLAVADAPRIFATILLMYFLLFLAGGFYFDNPILKLASFLLALAALGTFQQRCMPKVDWLDLWNSRDKDYRDAKRLLIRSTASLSQANARPFRSHIQTK